MKRKINPETLQECFSDYRYEPIFSLQSTKVLFWGNLPASWTVCFPRWEARALARVDTDCRAQPSGSCLYNYGTTGSISLNPHDRFWSGLSVKSPVLDQFQWTKLNGSQGKFGRWLPVFQYFQLFIFPMEVQEKGGKGLLSRKCGSQKF